MNMGIVCGKSSATAVRDRENRVEERSLGKGSSELRVGRAISSRREENFRVKKINSSEIKIQVVDRKANGSRRVRDDYYEKNNENYEVANNFPGLGNIPKALEGEQLAAGWPSWLASAAGEALKGWLPLKAENFQKLDKIGQGTYSSVYKAQDLKHNKVVALKRVRFDNMDAESVKFMAREILILRRLDHPNIIKLQGLITSGSSSSLHLVFEYMEHDLTGLASLPGPKFAEPQIKCYMQQLLSGLEHCHSRGVLHRDIKGSNLLIDNNGILKIADFGLANFFDHHQSIPLTSRVVTLWYRPPELLLGARHYGTAVDLWSTGCILGELYTGKPIMPGQTEVEQLHKIFKLCGSPSEDYWRKAKLMHSTVFKPHQPYKRRVAETFKDLPVVALKLMDTLLSIDPSSRGTASSALKSEFFSTEPFACDPSSLPKYPPSKEIDAKLREEEAKRQGGTGVKSQRINREPWISNESHVQQPDAKADTVSSTQRRSGQHNSKPRSELFSVHKAEPASGYPADRGVKEKSSASYGNPPQRIAFSGPLGPGAGWTSGQKCDDTSFTSTRADLSNMSGLVASRTLSSEDSRDNFGHSRLQTAKQREKSLQLSEGPKGKRNSNHRTRNDAPQYVETGRANNRPAPHEQAMKGSNIHFSGPLLAQPSKVEQMLKEHDRQIQEAARRARLEKTRLTKAEAHGAHPVYAYGRSNR